MADLISRARRALARSRIGDWLLYEQRIALEHLRCEAAQRFAELAAAGARLRVEQEAFTAAQLAFEAERQRLLRAAGVGESKAERRARTHVVHVDQLAAISRHQREHMPFHMRNGHPATAPVWRPKPWTLATAVCWLALVLLAAVGLYVVMTQLLPLAIVSVGDVLSRWIHSLTR